MPAILAEAPLHPELAAKFFVEEGFSLQTCSLPEMAARLAENRFNTVILGECLVTHKTSHETGTIAEELIRALRKFLSWGGGLFFVTPGNSEPARRLLEAFGIGFRPMEPIGAAPANNFQPGDQSIVAYADKIDSGFSANVHGIWFPFSMRQQAAVFRPHGEPGSKWRVLAAISDPGTIMTAQAAKSLCRHKMTGFPQDQPLIICRDRAPGRIAVCGISSRFHLHAPAGCPAARSFLVAGFDTRPSGLRQLLLDITRWLAAPSMDTGALGGAPTDPLALQPQTPRFPDEPPLIWPARQFPPDGAGVRGVIGARTRLSGANGSVADYAIRARDAGHGFIVFLESFPEISRENWRLLKKECAACCGPDFQAVPGYFYNDGNGWWRFHFGSEIAAPHDGIGLCSKLTGSRDSQAAAPDVTAITGRCGLFRLDTTEGVELSSRHCDSIGVVTWENGALTHSIMAGYAALVDKGLRLHPTAITMLNHPDDFDRLLACGWHNALIEPYAAAQGVVLSKNDSFTQECWSTIDEKNSATPLSRLTHRQYGLPIQYLSSGPVISAWVVSASARDPQWRDPDSTIPPSADLFRNDITALRLRLAVRSAAGLAEVFLHNGAQTLRHWLPRGETLFVTELDLQYQQQMHLHLEARDVAGATALSGDYLTCRRDWCVFYDTDRLTPQAIGLQKTADNHLAGWAAPIAPNIEPLPWSGITASHGEWQRHGDPIYPCMPQPPYDPPQPFCDNRGNHHGPGLHVKPVMRQDQEPLAMEVQPAFVSADVMICSFALAGGHDRTLPPFGSALRRQAMLYRPRPGGLSLMTHRYDVYLEIASQAGRWLPTGWFAAADTLLLHGADGAAVPVKEAAAAQPLPWPRGAAVSLCRAGAPPAIFFNQCSTDLRICRPDESNSHLWPDGRPELCFAVDAAAIPSDSGHLSICFIAVGGRLADTAQTVVQAMRESMGLAGAPRYRAELARGTIVTQNLILKIAGEPHHGTHLFIGRSSLPMALPLAVSGLHDRRSVMLLDCRSGRYRPLGVLDGTAHAVIDTESQDWEVYIGHPFIVSHPLVCYTLAPVSGDRFTLELHNPTAYPLKTEIIPAPEFTIVSRRRETITIPSGSSVLRSIPIIGRHS